MKQRFIYKIINDKVIQRKIFILETLNNCEDFVPSQYMADLLQCTVRTIAKDIAELKGDLPKEWIIIGVANKGYILQKPLTDSIYPIIGSFLSQSIVYKVMIEIFNNRYYTLEKWSQILYVNKKTLRDKLKIYARTLNQSNIDFKYEQLDLTGNEVNIRFYYCVFFYMTSKYINQPMLPMQLKNKLSAIFKSYSLSIDYEGAFHVIFVFISRNLNKNHIKKIVDLPPFNDKYIFLFDNIVSTLESFYKIKLYETEKKALMFFLFFLIKIEHNDLIIESLNKSNSELFKKSQQIVCLLTNNNTNTQVGTELFVKLLPYLLKIYYYNRNGFSIRYVFEPLHDSKSILLYGYNKNLPQVSFWNDSFCDGIFNNNEIEFITTHATIIINSAAQKHVLFLFSGNNAIEKILYSKLKKGLGNTVMIYRKPMDNVTFDIIISNYKHEQSKTPTIYISETLSENKILLISNLLQE
ncbi:hypothetical protein BK727_07285 [Bacillus thuringiensis serovar roskildiensis]|uniref:HTH domain-containing protein n=1 Tax=Bacillus thuringiensis serovar sooncheon TaxID=180891 RepID=A0A9Q5X515_BACTU|nr:helix-turn-helix domain containing protein [Bacillus thuringiensis]MEB9661371.1 helix-turn-helix domain containing protein [Bacillus cereus]ARV91363.1 hypothetical protein BJG91_01525 [Bacillus thuringiensis]OTW70706.1 hypothetical protein BK707_11020 [Bacillus thuringiensis serovar coreanensis]OTX53149.1 hypothetical protein BK724_04745 [Bacillus thuringiensis serovar sooncheon]OTX56880.1 hypothetical protein BK725_08330 [Bacillus thuringiensis serovar guiyangiensis]